MRLVKFFKERVELVVAIAVAFEGLQFVIGVLTLQLPGWGAAFREYSTYILLAASVLIFALLVVALMFFRTERLERIALQRTLDDERTARTLLEANSRADHESEVARLSRENTQLNAFLHKFKECSPLYLTLASKNAVCDWSLFHCLFIDISREQPDLRKAIETAKRFAIENIREVLTTAASVFTIHTGCPSAACIQVIRRVDGSDIDDAIIETILRDRLSETRRFGPGGTHKVGDNTIHRRIFIDRCDGLIINDLKAALADPAFRTSSRIWEGVYNAVLILPIPKMLSSKTENLFSTEVTAPPQATLCIDNRNGGFVEELHMQLARDLAWRLSVMLYRLEWLVGAGEQPWPNGGIR